MQFNNELKMSIDTSPEKTHRWQMIIGKDAAHHMPSRKCKLKQ
jgi:hypothetical protein